MTDFQLLYVTCRDLQEARTMAHALVTEKLIACANLLPQMESVYTWNDKLETSNEVVALFKTTRELTTRATARILELHSYEVPCVLTLPVEGTTEAYGEWLRACVRSSKQ